jgi:DNA-binding SARP family transcriptional activator/dipeptidyl aminopeptidase/acylaminoacyl peptidase
LALLALLAVRREIRRDEVVDLLWRGVEEGKARNAFRQALHRLRGAVGDDVLPQDRERLRLVPGDRLQIDLDRFEAEIAAGRLAEAIDACAGDFLENSTLGEPPFDMWVEQERTRLRSRIARVLSDAASMAAAEGRWTEAVARTNRLMSIAPLETSSAQLAATTLIAAGRRHEARDLLKQFATTLDAELGLPLPVELQSMLSRLERQQGPAEATAQTRPRSSARDVLQFVGREAELSQLVTLCRTSAEESGGFALVKGESGLGKTRLLMEVMAHLKSLGRMTVLHGREHVAGVQLPYAVFAESLRPLARAPGVAGASRHLLAEAARLLPELRDEMDLPAVSDVEDEAGRLRFFEGIAALMDAAAFERSIVLVIDDAHLAGPSTMELLSYLCARLSRSAVTFVLAVKPSDAPASMLARLESIARPDSQTHPDRALSLELKRLDPDVARAAMTQATAAMGVDATTIGQAVSRSDGVPVRLVEMTRRVLRGMPLSAAPVSMRDVVVDRIARLTSVQRRLLFVIALIARPTTKSVAGAAAHLPDAAVDDALNTLAADDLIELRADGSIEIDDETARAALELAGPSTRAFLSGWIADELSSRSAPAAELARFFAAAGQSRPAFEQSRLAAFAALRMGAVPEATHHLKVARAFATTPGDATAVESLLNAVGAGHRQIDTPSAVSFRADPPTADAASAAAPQPRPASRHLESLFPNWRILLGAAVATLVLSAFILASRPSDLASPSVRGRPLDTLVVADDQSFRLVTGDPVTGFRVSEPFPPFPTSPAWIDSLSPPWAGPLVAPTAAYVALARVNPSGSDIYVFSVDRRDTVRLAVGEGDARPLAWSPDGKRVLGSVGRRRDGGFDTDLYAFAADGAQPRYPIDTSSERSITEAQWSPDGARIAWVARLGAERQLDVFVSDADGRNVRNVSRHPADDREIAWSPSGDLVVFTSDRDGSGSLYAASVRGDPLRRLTFDSAQNHAVAFSSDGRFVAFESTREGSRGVFVVALEGGEERRVDPRPFSLVRWARGDRRFVDRVRIRQPIGVMPGDTATLRAAAVNRLDDSVAASGVRWAVLDSGFVLLLPADSSSSEVARVVAKRPGVARVVVSVGGWRLDTAYIRVGTDPIVVVDGSSPSMRQWRALGVPAPVLDSTAGEIFLTADREWESGVISRAAAPLLPGLRATATFHLPLGTAQDPATAISLAIVAPENSATVDSIAPRFLRYATLAWQADGNRLVYSVGREVFAEPVSAAKLTSPVTVRVEVERDSTVSFFLAGQRRWRSALRVLGTRQSSRVQLWIAGRATGNLVRVAEPEMTLGVPNEK